MRYSPHSDPKVPLQTQAKPRLTSYDSSEECSFDHWLEVCRLVEIVDRSNSELGEYVFDDTLLLVSDSTPSGGLR